MRYCGQLIQMDYTPQLSNGTFYDIDILVNSFGYDPCLYFARANEYTMSGWDELLYNELRGGRPLVYGGQSTGGGHAYVIDGYEVAPPKMATTTTSVHSSDCSRRKAHHKGTTATSTV